MKKVLIALLAILLCFGTAFCFVACKDDEEETQKTTKVQPENNLAAMSSSVAYSATRDLLDNPSKYEGEVIRIKGYFSQGSISGGSKKHYFIDVYDPGCTPLSNCSAYAWTTFAWNGDLPKEGTLTTVTGVVRVKKENGNSFPEIQAETVKF